MNPGQVKPGARCNFLKILGPRSLLASRAPRALLRQNFEKDAILLVLFLSGLLDNLAAQ